MSHDLFTGAPDTAARARQSSLLAASLVIHAAIVAALVVASALLPGVVPSPRAAGLSWDDTRLVRLDDIPLPAARHTVAASRPSVAAPNVRPAPTPLGVTPRVGDTSDGSAVGLLQAGVDGGMTGFSGLIEGTTIAAPPPPPPEPSRDPIRLHAGVAPPIKLQHVSPAYPPLARSIGAQGVVIIEATIDARGEVVAARVLRSVPMLDEAALDAVRQWRYAPARLNGEAVAVLVTVTVQFRLGR